MIDCKKCGLCSPGCAAAAWLSGRYVACFDLCAKDMIIVYKVNTCAWRGSLTTVLCERVVICVCARTRMTVLYTSPLHITSTALTVDSNVVCQFEVSLVCRLYEAIMFLSVSSGDLLSDSSC